MAIVTAVFWALVIIGMVALVKYLSGDDQTQRDAPLASPRLTSWLHGSPVVNSARPNTATASPRSGRLGGLSGARSCGRGGT
jgi:hypothetical protein